MKRKPMWLHARARVPPRVVSNNAAVRHVREEVDSTKGWAIAIWDAQHPLRNNGQSVILQQPCDVEVSEDLAIDRQIIVELIRIINELPRCCDLPDRRECVHIFQAFEEVTIAPEQMLWGRYGTTS